ncbi:MAG: hypothetical protein ABI131_03360 [Nostocoides sp.]
MPVTRLHPRQHPLAGSPRPGDGETHCFEGGVGDTLAEFIHGNS